MSRGRFSASWIREPKRRSSSPRRLRSLLGVRSVAGQVFVLQVVVVVVLVAAAVVALVLQARSHATEEALDRSLAVAETFAKSKSPEIVDALESDNPTAQLQPVAEEARKGSGVGTLIVYDTNGIAYTHPNPDRIGKRIVGPEKIVKKQLAGKSISDAFVASLGPSAVSAVPVTNADGSFVGGVSVGITIKNVQDVVGGQLPVLFGAAGGALALATGGAALVSRRLRRQTRGLGPVGMTRMYEHHYAVLHAVREGVLIIGGDGRLLLVNDEARRLLELPVEVEGRHVAEVGLDAEAAGLLVSGRAVTDEVLAVGERLLAVNVRPTAPFGGPAGSVATLRDSTELRALAGRAEVARERLLLLYEASVRIGTTLEVTRTAEELAEVTVPRFADFVGVDLPGSVLAGEEPLDPDEPLRRVALGAICEGFPLHQVGETIHVVSSTPEARSLASGRPVLEPVLKVATGWLASDHERGRRILAYGIHSLIIVPLRARGVTLGVVSFYRAERGEPFEEDDLAVAEELVGRAAVCIDNARRYTREHAVAVTLQRSLLPRGLPAQDAVEVAHRYLPAPAGVGGDWFDVIPLPGARVALVVGDVVGHGLRAAATMGRMRTAVHNFSALDLPPEELLAHLDDLVARIDADQAAEDEGESVAGAGCLYAIYDPVSGRVTAARAGHVGPALVSPDGAVTFPEVPLSPPLGVGGEPFEHAELTLPAGSRLVLFTDGLIVGRDRDPDAGLELLGRALADAADRGLEETCQAVCDAVLPADRNDDIALLIARTRLLDPAQVADWEVPYEPAAVAPVRAACTRQLEAWGLAEIGFATELILSELITNAIRYGAEPVRVRLLHGRTLICEVSDGSSTSPHLRRAAATDEGGRGLFLVTQFAQRWGTRYTANGKVIWAEQALRNGASEPGPDLADILLNQSDDFAL